MNENKGTNGGGNLCWISLTLLLACSIVIACLWQDDRPEITARIAEEVIIESGMDPHCDCKACDFIRSREAAR